MYVSINDVVLSSEDYSIDSRTLVFNTAPTNGAIIRIYRETTSQRLVSWADASVLKSADMTISQVQQNHLIEESQDWSKINSIVLEGADNNDPKWNMQYHRVVNVATPVESGDAVTKGYMESVQDGFVQRNATLEANAAKSASAASTSAANAKTSENNAKASATQAANSASAAASSASTASSKATAAGNSASAASTSAANAKTSENNAATSASTASSKASAASTSATNAKNSETAAAASASTASSKATTATQQATKATEEATKAKNYAESLGNVNQLNDALFTSGLGKNGIFRGKNLGTISASNIDTFLSTHKVSSGVFEDLYLGDYFTIQDGTYNAVWMIAGFDTEYNKGDTAFTTHHISIIPRTILTSARMNASNTTANGYKGSEMHVTTLPGIAAKLKTALGSHLLSRRVLLSNSMSTSLASMAGAGWTGAANGWEWTDAELTLLSEPQVYGGTVLSSSFYDVGEANQKLPVFNFINFIEYGRSNFWLRAVATSTGFCIANGYGSANYDGASHSIGVRPLVCLG